MVSALKTEADEGGSSFLEPLAAHWLLLSLYKVKIAILIHHRKKPASELIPDKDMLFLLTALPQTFVFTENMVEVFFFKKKN